MSTFETRDNEFQTKYQHDEELKFKIQARRDFKFGQWVADKLGLRGHDAVVYAQSMIATGLEVPGDSDILARVQSDAAKHRKNISEEDCFAKLDEFEAAAEEEIMKE